LIPPGSIRKAGKLTIAATPTKRGTAGARQLYRSRKAVIAALRERLLQRKTIQAQRVLKDDMSLHAAVIRYFGNFAEAHAHFRVHPPRETRWHRAEKSAIISEIRRRRRKHESLRLAKVRKVKHARALLNRCDKLFGSWNAALLAAGVKPARENSPWPRANKAAVVTEIRQRKRTGKSLIAKQVERSKWGSPLVRRANVLFGSWRNALLSAGIDDWLRADSDYRSGIRRQPSLRVRRVVRRR
jgi:hypothetical protein